MTLQRILLSFSSFLILLLQANATIIPTCKRTVLRDGWQFCRGDRGSIWEVVRPVIPGKPESVPAWTTVSLPHCFNADDACDPDRPYYQGPGWYRTLLEVNNPYDGGRTLLEFEGAGQKTSVYIYDQPVATHVGGYDGWTADITDAVRAFADSEVCRQRFHGKIPLAVRCDNSRDTEMIPSDLSDFNLYGGIYRHLHLVYLPRVSFRQVHLTPTLQRRRASIRLDLRFNNPQRRKARLKGLITGPDKKVVAHIDQLLSDTLLTLQCAIKNPQLWSPDTPRLYTCNLTLVEGSDSVVVCERFGLRNYEFTEHGPFLLNGKRLLLKGTHRHDDQAGVGAALTDEMIHNEMVRIKQMGANFIRLGHYQQSDTVLRLCDELGIMVWEEIPWCRGGVGGHAYKEQARRMLRNMITQHYNHPSVILWGMGNENDWPGDFPQFATDSIRHFMRSLVDAAHRLDPQRLTVIRRCDFAADLPDVYSPSVWAGWYSQRYKDYYRMTKKKFDAYPRFIHAEWGGDSHPGRHTATLDTLTTAADRNGDWSESYIVSLFDWHLKEQQRMPWLTGTLFWTFKDFSTPLRPRNPIPYVNQKGVVQRDGTPKEAYYVVQSYWSKQPMIHIYGHSWPVRWGNKGDGQSVMVYSNCQEVELFLNGHSMGKRKRSPQNFPAAGLHWNVVFTEGKNVLTAIGWKGKLCVTDTIRQEYQTQKWGEPAKLTLKRTNNMLTAQVYDGNDVRCLDAAQFVRFGTTNDEALMKNTGTSTGSRLIQLANGRAEIRIKNITRTTVVTVDMPDHPDISPAIIILHPTEKEHRPAL